MYIIGSNNRTEKKEELFAGKNEKLHASYLKLVTT
jgi:hypothetical protein